MTRLGCSDCDGAVQIGRLHHWRINWTFQHHFCLLFHLIKDHQLFLVKHSNVSLGGRLLFVLVDFTVIVVVVVVAAVVVVVVVVIL